MNVHESKPHEFCNHIVLVLVCNASGRFRLRDPAEQSFIDRLPATVKIESSILFISRLTSVNHHSLAERRNFFEPDHSIE